MATYNGVAGVDEAALNGFIQAAYNLARTEICHGSVSVANLNLGALTSIEYDIAQAPRVVLTPSSMFRDMHLAALGGPPDTAAYDAELTDLVDTASKASFDLIADRVVVSLRYRGQDDTRLEASLRASLAVTADSGGVLTPQLAKLALTVAGEPVLSDLLNKGLAPYLEEYLKSTILAPVKIPPLGYGKVFLSPPAVTTGQGRLLVTTAIAPAIAEPAPLAGAWPAGRVFAGVDLTLVNELIKQLLPTLRPADGTWSKTISFWLGHSTLKADYHASVRSATLGFVPDHPDQLQGTATADIHIHLYAKNLFSWTGSGTATATLRAQAVVGADHDLAVKLAGLDNLSVNVDFHNTPAWADKEIGNLVTSMRMVLAPSLAAILAAQPPVNLAKIPSFPLAAGDETVMIGLKDVLVAPLPTPDGKTLLGASGTPDVRVVPMPGILSSGSTELRGTYTFDLETGTQGGSGPGEDLWWEQADPTVRYLRPQNGAMLAHLGQPDFDAVNLPALRAAPFSATPIDGSDTAANQLTPGSVIAVKTGTGHFAKIIVTGYGYNLGIKWVTYSGLQRPGDAGG